MQRIQPLRYIDQYDYIWELIKYEGHKDNALVIQFLMPNLAFVDEDHRLEVRLFDEFYIIKPGMFIDKCVTTNVLMFSFIDEFEGLEIYDRLPIRR